jgi:hypothetical protein
MWFRKIIMIEVKSALRIEVKILLVRNELKDCNEKPGRRQRPNKLCQCWCYHQPILSNLHVGDYTNMG